jgi:phosphatidylglycerol---prolipoprotein diacylglyceryl transferase
MLQTLFHIPAQVAGYPVFGFGLLLAVWAVASVVTLAVLVRRQGFNADTRGYVWILLVIGAIIAWLLPAISERTPDGARLGPPIRGYGVMMLLAVVAGTLLAVWRGRRRGLDPDLIFSLVLWMIVPGIVGARAFYVIEYWDDTYVKLYTGPHGSLAALLAGVLNVTEGGLVVYGSFFGGVLGILLFIRKHRLPLLALCDLMAPAMLLGLAIGRIGCLLNGCCFGAVCDHPLAIRFPAGSPAYMAQVQRGQMYGFTLSGNPKAKSCVVLAVDPKRPAAPAGLKAGDLLESINGFQICTNGNALAAIEKAFHEGESLDIRVKDRPAIVVPAVEPPRQSLAVQPAQPLSTIDALLLCLLLLAYDPFRRRDGELFAVMMSIYPITRFLIEGLRTDEAGVLGTTLSIGQCVSLLLLLVAGVLWWYILRQPKGLAFPTRVFPLPLGAESEVRAGGVSKKAKCKLQNEKCKMKRRI